MDQIDLTYREARVYLCAAVIFLGSVPGVALPAGAMALEPGHGLAASH